LTAKAPSAGRLDRDPAGWAGNLLAMHGLETGQLEPMAGWSNQL
jgi:hypothetical protein